MPIIAVVGNKGGAGKTTLSVNLAAGISRNHSIAMIDADPQGSSLQWRAIAGDNVSFPVYAPTFSLKEQAKSYTKNNEYVLIDCPPSLGLLTINALVAADQVLVPVQAEFLGLRGLALFWQTMQQVEPLNPHLRLLGILPTMTRRTRHHAEILETMSKIKAYVFEPIPLSVKASEAHAVGRAVSTLDGDNAVAKAYASLAREVERLW